MKKTRDEVREMIHQWGMDRLERLEEDNITSKDGNIARTIVRISAELAREAGVKLPSGFEPNDQLSVVHHWNFKERTIRNYYVFWVHMPSGISDDLPFLHGNGEFLSEEAR